MDFVTPLIGLGGALLGVISQAIISDRSERRVAARESAVRREDYLRKRLDGFEEVLAEFVPVYREWSREQTLWRKHYYADMSDSDPEPDFERAWELNQSIDRYLATFAVRSPSSAMTAAVAKVEDGRAAVTAASNLISHEETFGTDEGVLAAKQPFIDALDALDAAVEALIKQNSADARR